MKAFIQQALPDDLILTAASDVAIRQHLTLVALGKRPADLAIRVGRLLAVHSRTWLDDQEIVISGRRIAWVGPAGTYRGEVRGRVEYPHLSAVPGFGEVHKHIESTYLTPEYEAALVIRHGNTWTCEASHEFANVNGAKNAEFWRKAREAGSPLKIFLQPGSAVPPTAYESSGGHYGYEEQSRFLREDITATGLDEVMDWPAVWDPANPSYQRIWGMIEATIEQRGVVEGHGSGLRERHEIAGFAAAGLSSDHEVWEAQEVLDKLACGLFVEMRYFCFTKVLPTLIEQLKDWSNVAFTTDDRSASDTLRLGATDHNARAAMALGLAPEIAIQCVTLHPARHMRIDAWVGSIAPGRFADIVLLDDVSTLHIAAVYADGKLAAEAGKYVGPLPKIAWPGWATDTIRIDRSMTADDFRIAAAPGRETMQAVVIRPFHWNADFMTYELPVADGAVLRDTSRGITKFAIVDRYHGDAKTASMFWLGCGPKTERVAVACSVAHDSHNIWAVGSCDEAMAMAVNHLRETGGGYALVRDGVVVANVSFEIGGLMTARPAEVLDAEMQAFYEVANEIEWMYEPSAESLWQPGFPEFLKFATLTCSPWRWVLVAPCELAPQGFVNVQTGETHPVVW
ncbi:Adenine deaminase [Granulicella pectinivorans]|uniref:adenine deaminase n=1 Tax=Granulicella pectinivorans TaxID=474950 RepID=A0A1I6M004_9BACT|nr:adenine deaminase C-terminal domain-containing protein [Granulicella pectinivorans]SFS09041.1 Adenine deaminase [Granulicella pectinivorans]